VNTLRVGCIGLGNMGSALIRALSGRGSTEIFGYDPDEAKVKTFVQLSNFSVRASSIEVFQTAEYVFVAVKPQVMEQVLTEISPVLTPGTCLISIAAGLDMKQLREWTGARCAVVRVMPNTPALVRAGVSGVCFDDPQLTKTQQAVVTELLELLGQVHVLPEKDFHAFTALVGSGPAYVYYFMDALVQSGVSLGLSRAQAETMVAGLLAGSVRLALETKMELSALQAMVTSPAGTTIAALNHMDRNSVRGVLIDAVGQAEKRSRALGRVAG
jgi:pyrroline-5-carboxylate reductase